MRPPHSSSPVLAWAHSLGAGVSPLPLSLGGGEAWRPPHCSSGPVSRQGQVADLWLGRSQATAGPLSPGAAPRLIWVRAEMGGRGGVLLQRADSAEMITAWPATSSEHGGTAGGGVAEKVTSLSPSSRPAGHSLIVLQSIQDWRWSLGRYRGRRGRGQSTG